MKRRAITILALIAMVLTLIPIQLTASSFSIESTRLYGVDRIDTALEVCSSGWDSANTVIVAPADQANLVDALAAAPLAGQENAPILLTFKDRLDPAVKAKITSLGADKVYVVGAIQDEVRYEIDAISGVRAEALKGSSRWETVRAINNKLYSIEGCFVVGYNSLADALSVSSYAAANRYAIILADVNGRIPSGQSTLGSTTYIIGGSSLVADVSGSATRIAGRDRFETNKLVFENLYFDYDKVYLANGFNNHLVDSLVAAPLAAKYKGPIVLTDNDRIEALSLIRSKMYSNSEVIALGGTSVISNTIREDLAGGSGYTPGTFMVRDIVPVSLNAFEVVFSNKVDKDTAENVTNYIVDGSSLTTGLDSAVLRSDGRTVMVMVDQLGISNMAPFGQYERVTIEVKKDVIYSEDKTISVGEYTKEVEFHDATQPRLSTVEAYGNTKLVVEFTEPVNVLSLTTNIHDWKIDGNNLSAYGINATATTAVNPTGGTAFPVSYAVELYFESGLSSGNHSLTVGDGISGVSGWLVDGANFTVQESSKDFRVDSFSGAPGVQSVTVDNNKVLVKFNRAMYKNPSDPNGGRGSALNTAYYDVNDKGESSVLNTSPLSSVPKFRSGSGDTIVELNVDTGVIREGVNVLEIDKDMEDAWGNRLDDDDNVRVSFTYEEDTTKPTVLSVMPLSDTKVRIHFSETIDKAYAQNRANYTIKDSDGVELFGNSAGGTANTIPLNQDSDTVELIMPGGTFLRQSGYTLKIENLRDVSYDKNVMSTYTTTFNGYDDRGPQLKEVVVDSNDSTKAICFFDEEISSESVRLDNFGYLDGAGNSNNLPSGSRLSIDGTGKIVTVDFPSAYTVKVTNGGAGDTNDKYEVNGIRASYIKDLEGNVMPGIAMTVNVQTTASGTYKPHYIQNSFYLYDDGDYVKAEIDMSQQISYLDKNDFSIGGSGVGYAGGTVPDSAYTSSEKIILRYTDDTKIRNVRALGPNAFIYSKAQATIQSKGSTGVEMLEFVNTGYQVYDDQIRPRVLLDDPVLKPFDLTYSGNDAVVVILFTEDIDGSVVGLYDDDFVFSCGGGSLNVQSVSVDAVDKRQLKYDVGPVADLPGSTITVNADNDGIYIRDLKDIGPKDHNTYVPTRDDELGRSISDTTTPTVTGVTVDSATEKVTVTFSEEIFAPGTVADFTVDSPYDEGKTTAAVAATAWTWAANKKSVELTFGAADFKGNDTYVLTFTSPGSSKYKDLGAHYLGSVTKAGFVNTSAADATFPTVAVPIGDGLGDGETIADGASVYVRFSEVLDAPSKTAVTNALTAGKGGAGSFNYAWNDNTAVLTATAAGGSVTFAGDITCSISDGTNANPGAVTILKQ